MSEKAYVDLSIGSSLNRLRDRLWFYREPMSLEADSEVPRGVPAVRHLVVKVREQGASECLDYLAVEEPLEIRLGGVNLTVTMRTPGDDEELVAGFLFSEGIITSADDLDVIARYRGPA